MDEARATDQGDPIDRWESFFYFAFYLAIIADLTGWSWVWVD